MRRALLGLLALAGVGCALVVTAASTTAQARGAGMTEAVPWALVGLLEVVSVVGTWTWITDTRPRVRTEAAVGVLASSGVTALCGALTYGPIGLVAPLGLLVAVHLVSRMWSAPEEVPTAVAATGEVHKREGVVLRAAAAGSGSEVRGEPMTDTAPRTMPVIAEMTDIEQGDDEETPRRHEVGASGPSSSPARGPLKAFGGEEPAARSPATRSPAA